MYSYKNCPQSIIFVDGKWMGKFIYGGIVPCLARVIQYPQLSLNYHSKDGKYLKGDSQGPEIHS